MESLVEMAGRLGKQIAAHERTQSLKQAQEAVNSNDEARTLIGSYQQQLQRIQSLEQQQQPIEIADKHKLQEIEQKISLNDQIKELTRRQADFVELMGRIKQAIDDELQMDL